MCATAELYNIFLFMSLSGANRLLEREEPFKSLIAQGRGVALGGKLSEFDPLGVGQNLAPQSHGQTLAAGLGYLITNAGVTSIRVPRVDAEEDE